MRNTVYYRATRTAAKAIIFGNIGAYLSTQQYQIILAKDFDQKKTSIVFQATHQQKNTSIFWYIDDTYIGATVDKHDMPIYTKPGKHKLTLMDEHGEELVRFFEMVER